MPCGEALRGRENYGSNVVRLRDDHFMEPLRGSGHGGGNFLRTLQSHAANRGTGARKKTAQGARPFTCGNDLGKKGD